MELLSPAGSWECLKAACEAGADAVYFGGKAFGARAFSENFDRENTTKALRHLRLRGVKSYVAVNTVLKTEEFDSCIDWVKFLYEEGADAVILSDIGLLYAVREFFPEMEIHASTQMSVGSYEGALFLCNLGIKRVVMGRETPLTEIEKIKELPIEVEIFCHGALCVSVSGKCLLSSVIGGRSGNRGRCAQPCRNVYRLLNNKKQIGLKGYYLSPKDLMTLGEIETFKSLGVNTLKIEGRMKRAEYVYVITSIYRRALDGELREEDFKDALQIFNRGFTKGITLGDFGKNFIGSRPDNGGILLGNVEKVDKNIFLRLYEDLEKGDGLSYVKTSGEEGGFISPVGGKRGEIVSFEKPKDFGFNSELRRTSSIKLIKSVSGKSKRKHRKVIFSFKAEAKKTMELVMTLYDESMSVKVYSVSIPEVAKSSSISADEVSKLLSKTGDTVYEVVKIETYIKENLFIPLGSINKLRREACAEMDACLLQISRSVNGFEDEKSAFTKSVVRRGRTLDERSLSISIIDKEQLKYIDPEKTKRIYAPFWDEKLVDYKEKYLFLPLYPKEEDIPEGKFDGVRVCTLDALNFALSSEVLRGAEIVLSEEMNLANPYSIYFLRAFWASEFSPSRELNLRELASLKGLDLPMEIQIYGRVPVMYVRNCPFSAVKNCTDELNCPSCDYRVNSSLIDLRKAEFPALRKNKMTVIYNSVPLMASKPIDKIGELACNARLDFTDEFSEISDIQTLFYDLWVEKKLTEYDKMTMEKLKRNFTNGHFERGVE